jgi:hypothetical protein
MEAGKVGYAPGCSVESTIFFACHISGVICLVSPVLYEVTSCFACSRPEDETKSVRGSTRVVECITRPQYVVKSYCDAGRSLEPGSEVDIGHGGQQEALRDDSGPVTGWNREAASAPVQLVIET